MVADSPTANLQRRLAAVEDHHRRAVVRERLLPHARVGAAGPARALVARVVRPGQPRRGGAVIWTPLSRYISFVTVQKITRGV